jgi:hypothetical protein
MKERSYRVSMGKTSVDGEEHGSLHGFSISVELGRPGADLRAPASDRLGSPGKAPQRLAGRTHAGRQRSGARESRNGTHLFQQLNSVPKEGGGRTLLRTEGWTGWGRDAVSQTRRQACKGSTSLSSSDALAPTCVLPRPTASVRRVRLPNDWPDAHTQGGSEAAPEKAGMGRTFFSN